LNPNSPIKVPLAHHGSDTEGEEDDKKSGTKRKNFADDEENLEPNTRQLKKINKKLSF
jgi:hypothetical protein